MKLSLALRPPLAGSGLVSQICSFLTEARWSDETVIGRLQEYLAPRLGHPEAVWVFDGAISPSRAGNLLRMVDIVANFSIRPGPVCCGGCAGGPAELPVKDILEMLAGLGVGLPQGRCRRRRLRDSPTFREGLAALGMRNSGRHYGLALGPGLDQSGISGVRPPPQTQAAAWAGPWSSAVMNCRMRLGGR